jgi:hypothetical protein
VHQSNRKPAEQTLCPLDALLRLTPVELAHEKSRNE